MTSRRVGAEESADPPSVDLPSEAATEPDERRAAPRYSPDPLVPVLFAHPLAETPTAGLLADVSKGGVRVVAPPTAQPFLHWGDPLRILVSYSESTREEGIEGMRLWAHVVRIAIDHESYRLHAAFTRGGTDGDWDKLSEWIDRLAVTVRR